MCVELLYENLSRVNRRERLIDRYIERERELDIERKRKTDRGREKEKESLYT